MREKLAAKDELIKRAGKREAEARQEIDQLRDTLSRAVSEQGLDPDRAVYITQKRQAIELIDEALDRAARAVADLEGIPYELIDAELSVKLSSAISAIDAGVYRVREHYGAAIWIPKNEAPRDLIPE